MHLVMRHIEVYINSENLNEIEHVANESNIESCEIICNSDIYTTRTFYQATNI